MNGSNLIKSFITNFLFNRLPQACFHVLTAELQSCVVLYLTKIVDLILGVFSIVFGVFGSLYQNVVNKIVPGKGRHAS